MEQMGHLARSPIFEDISPEAVQALCDRGLTCTFSAGHQVFERGQDADAVMILQEGTVELFFPVRIMGAIRPLTLETKQAGDVVAWSALVSPYRFTLSARCATKSILVGMNREILRDYFETAPHVGYLFMRNLAGVVGRRFQAMQTLWIGELQASAAEKLE